MTLVQENIYRRTDVGTVGWDDELDAVLLRWHGFATSESFRAHMRLCIELLEATGANKMYADARDQGPINDEDKLWSITEWASQADDAGLDALVIVYPESVIAKMAVDSVMEQVEDDIDRLITDDVEEGREWLADRPATVTDVAVSELTEPTLEVEPAPDTGDETDGDDVPTGSDPNPESPADSTADDAETSVSGNETEADSANAESTTSDGRSAPADADSVSSPTSTETAGADSAASVDPPTVAAVGGIVGLIGMTLATVAIGRIPILVANGVANAVLLLGGAALVGMTFGWASAKFVA
ncbi:hypothetical protein [Natrinema sp. HArc-T2]|uniref:hypothetical protein n=1 Tax=Natrinema sp. HArc-T2 TaxID=3242701 RepID=UPI00359CC0A5